MNARDAGAEANSLNAKGHRIVLTEVLVIACPQYSNARYIVTYMGLAIDGLPGNLAMMVTAVVALD